MRVAPENANAQPMDVMNELNAYTGPLGCIFFLISTLLFAFLNNIPAIAFGGLFFSLALIIIIIKFVVIFCYPGNTFIPRTVGRQKGEALALLMGLLTNTIAAIRSSSDSDALKTLQVIFYMVSIVLLVYLSVVISKEQYKIRAGNGGLADLPSNGAIVGGPTQCSICISIIRSDQKFVRLGCGHRFHEICFQVHLDRRCPNCRGPF